MRFYLQFQNPLDIVAQAWHERNMARSDMSSSMDFLWGRRGDVTRENAPIRETVPEHECSEAPEAIPPAQPLTLQEQLHEKMSLEYKAFINELKSRPASEILEAAYEKVFKEELLMMVENSGFYDDQLTVLLTLETPLAELYWNWLDTDAGYLDMLRDSIDNFADAIYSKGVEEQTEKEPAQTAKELVKPQHSHIQNQQPSLLEEVRAAAREVETRKTAQTDQTPKKSQIKEKELS
jgi:hypothetical protein